MGSAVIFSGTDVKTLKSNIDINGQAKILTGTVDPSASATSAPIGSVYLNTSSGLLYRKLDAGSSTNWVILGADGAGGVNLLGLNAAFQGTNTNDRNAESSVGNWVTYADAAAVTPVDMTGGAPAQTVLSRTTTSGEVLNGSGSFKIVKSAANAQGEGASVVTNIPPGYRGQTVSLSLTYKVISGSVVSGDLKLFAYDVTNSTLITPYNNNVYGAQGSITATFPLSSTTAQIRVGFFFASTSTTAVTFSFDDVAIAPNVAITTTGFDQDFISYNTTTGFGGWGTPTGVDIWYKVMGDSVMLRGRFTPGSVTSADATLPLPSGMVCDPVKNALLQMCGTWTIASSLSPATPLIIEPSATFINFGIQNQASGGFTKIGGTAPTAATISFLAVVPILGKSTNVTLAASSTFKASNLLISGTRVTGAAPTAQGQYRSYLRASSAVTYSETNGTPGTLPTAADGIKLWNSGAYGTADPTGAPSRYEIFVGAQKNVQFQFYASAGRTGVVDTTPGANSTTAFGYQTFYDPATGIATVVGNTNVASVATLRAGVDATGGTAVASPIFFDIIVSENALQVGVQAPRSEVVVRTYAGVGSTNTMIERFTTVEKNIGSGVTYTSSSTLGDSFLINEDGIYNVYFGFQGSNVTAAGVTLNSVQLTTAFNAVTPSTIVCGGICASAGIPITASRSINLKVGDIIRPHLSASGVGGNTYVDMFAITKESN